MQISKCTDKTALFSFSSVADIHIGTSSFDKLVESGQDQIMVLDQRQIKFIIAEWRPARDYLGLIRLVALSLTRRASDGMSGEGPIIAQYQVATSLQVKRVSTADPHSLRRALKISEYQLNERVPDSTQVGGLFLDREKRIRLAGDPFCICCLHRVRVLPVS